jgi:biotin carboxyl carrier protein
LHYQLDIEGEAVSLGFSPVEGKNTAEVSVDAGTHRVCFHALPDGRLHLVIDGKAIEAFLVAVDNGKQVFIDGHTFLVRNAGKGYSRRPGARSADEIPDQVTPPMPSVVVRILVRAGDRVRRGQGLVVVSAMKMETTLVAPHDGRVAGINTAVDAKVAPGDILVDIEKEASKDE